MTLMKSLLLGSAAALVVAGAQAADLPTKKGAPAAQYVKICNINGIAGFVIPGSDTCLKISGGVMAMASTGNLDDQYVATKETKTFSVVHVTHVPSWDPVHTFTHTYYKFVESDSKYRDEFGEYARADLGLEAVSNTAYGPLISVIDIHWDQGWGQNQAGPDWTYINEAYIQWAGITAGIKPSFYDFIGGGETWFNMISPEHTGTGIPLFAYTATFGGGFSATISAEENADAVTGRPTIAVAPETFFGYGANTYLGARAPDIVGAVDLTQGWGMAHAAVVAHNYTLESPFGFDDNGWGWGVLGGVGFNLPQLGAGDVPEAPGRLLLCGDRLFGLHHRGLGPRRQRPEHERQRRDLYACRRGWQRRRRLVISDHLGGRGGRRVPPDAAVRVRAGNQLRQHHLVEPGRLPLTRRQRVVVVRRRGVHLDAGRQPELQPRYRLPGLAF